MQKVLIAIQARNTSTRLPGKAFLKIGGKRMLDHVIESCERAAKYSNRFETKKNYHTEVVILIPTGDPIKQAFSGRMFEGSESDVLDRYFSAACEFNADYICRITGDCPLIPPYIISKHISIALVKQYDYLSNVDESCRLCLDGIDTEVMSMKMLSWLKEKAQTQEEREHVTLLARRNPPEWARRGFTAGHFNQSKIKLSVDTEEDLERVRREYVEVGEALREAHKKYDYDCIHRF